jgi:hypothetical protein
MIQLPLWTNGPFELLVHAEGHLQSGEDFDRRMALISFDNAIEVAISTYLTLPPLLRGGQSYARADTDKWLRDYHTKLEFLGAELVRRRMPWTVDKRDIIYAHHHRNEQYHGGHKGAPEIHVLSCIRTAALWVFEVLYDDPDVETHLAQAVLSSSLPRLPQHDSAYDRALDRAYGMVELGRQAFYASEVFFSLDYTAYQAEGERLCALRVDAEDEEPEE